MQCTFDPASPDLSAFAMATLRDTFEDLGLSVPHTIERNSKGHFEPEDLWASINATINTTTLLVGYSGRWTWVDSLNNTYDDVAAARVRATAQKRV